MLEHYILNDKGEPVLCEDIMEWAQKFEIDNRRVSETTIKGKRLFEDDLWISTVFLGLNHAWHGGPPVVWETMIFRQGISEHPLDQWMDRCSGSREQALSMHERCVQYVKDWSALDTFPRRLNRWVRGHIKYAIEWVKANVRFSALKGRLANAERTVRDWISSAL